MWKLRMQPLVDIPSKKENQKMREDEGAALLLPLR